MLAPSALSIQPGIRQGWRKAITTNLRVWLPTAAVLGAFTAIPDWAPAQQATNSTRYEGPIIDVHLHAIDRIAAGQERRYCFPKPCEGAPTQAKSADDLKRLTLAAMARKKIVMGILSGPRVDVVLRWTENDRTSFRIGIVLLRPDDVPLDTLRALYTSGRAQVLGEIGVQYSAIAIDDPSLGPLFALAHELDLPVHVHVTGLGGTTDFPVNLGNPLRLVPVLRKYPGLRVYLENAGWPFLEEVTSLMYQYPSVFADVSTILHLIPRTVALKYLHGLRENGLGKRIMFGSDQMVWPEVIDVAVDAIQSANFLAQDEKADIFYNNAARFFRLTEEEKRRHHGR